MLFKNTFMFHRLASLNRSILKRLISVALRVAGLLTQCVDLHAYAFGSSYTWCFGLFCCIVFISYNTSYNQNNIVFTFGNLVGFV